MADKSSSGTVFGVPPNEKDGLGAAGRAGGSGTVTEDRGFAPESRHVGFLALLCVRNHARIASSTPLTEGYIRNGPERGFAETPFSRARPNFHLAGPPISFPKEHQGVSANGLVHRAY